MIAGKNILITGANGGIGFAVAKLLAEQKNIMHMMRIILTRLVIM